MRYLLFISFVTLVLGSPLKAPRNFTNYKLISARLPSADLFNDVQKLELQGLLEIWSDAPRRDGSILFSVSPNHFEEIRTTLIKSKIASRVAHHNLQALIDSERSGVSYSSPENRPINFHQFESYDQIAASLKYYASSPDSLGLVETFVVGKTYEGREIVGIKISNSNETKPIVFLECGIHAREWAATSTCLYMVDQLATKRDSYKDLLDKYEFRVVPSLNSDGYEYTRNTDRLWRKNRSPGPKSSGCYGVDLNRNVKAGPHCGVGTSTDPCAETYCGPAEFSEPETAALRDYLQTIEGKVDYYIAFHTYGLMFMFPYSYTTEKCADYDELYRRGKLGVDAIKAKTGTSFTFGPIATTIYEVTGSTVDWVYDSLRIKKSYALELEPSGSTDDGFIVNPKQIISIADETFTGMKALWLS